MGMGRMRLAIRLYRSKSSNIQRLPMRKQWESESPCTMPSHPASISGRRSDVTLFVFLHRTKSPSLSWLMNCVLHASMLFGKRSLSFGDAERCKRSLRGLAERGAEDDGSAGFDMVEYISIRSSGQCLMSSRAHRDLRLVIPPTHALARKAPFRRLFFKPPIFLVLSC